MSKRNFSENIIGRGRDFWRCECQNFDNCQVGGGGVASQSAKRMCLDFAIYQL